MEHKTSEQEEGKPQRYKLQKGGHEHGKARKKGELEM